MRRWYERPPGLWSLGLEHLLGAHCTGIEAVYRLRQHTGMTRATAAAGAVGGFTLAGGLASCSISQQSVPAVYYLRAAVLAALLGQAGLTSSIRQTGPPAKD